MRERSGVTWGLLILTSSFALLYRHVIAKLVHDWAYDGNYSHGFLVAPLAAYFVWERRHRLRDLPAHPHWAGLPVVAASLVLLAAGVLGAELFVTRFSMLGMLAGGTIFILGWRQLKILAFPLAFLVLMIPIPSIIFNQIAFPLQLLASRVGEQILSGWGIPVLREGNVIVLANTTLEVAEACSGMRSLISLLTLGIVFGYFVDPRSAVRAAIALTTVPVAIAANGLRVAGTGIAAHYYGASAATGFVHTFSGWLVFVMSLGMLLVVTRLISWLTRLAPVRTPQLADAGLGPDR